MAAVAVAARSDEGMWAIPTRSELSQAGHTEWIAVAIRRHSFMWPQWRFWPQWRLWPQSRLHLAAVGKEKRNAEAAAEAAAEAVAEAAAAAAAAAAVDAIRIEP